MTADFGRMLRMAEPRPAPTRLLNSAYIQAKTNELVYTIAGPEFGPLQGRTMLIDRALYGLQASGNAWHEKISDDIYSMGFVKTKADSDLWIKRNGDHYEFIAIFVDDVLVFSTNPKKIFDTLQNEFGYEFKDISEPEYYNGADIYFDKETQCHLLGSIQTQRKEKNGGQLLTKSLRT